jgi:tetratricopeptide (TPR) repeat protein
VSIFPIEQHYNEIVELFYDQKYLTAIEKSTFLIQELQLHIQDEDSQEQTILYKTYLANIFQLLGQEHEVISQYSSSIKYYNQALTIAKEIGSLQIQIRVYSGLSNVCYLKGHIKQAIEYLLIAKEMVEQTTLQNEKIMILGNLVQNYNEVFDFETAHTYFDLLQESLVQFNITSYFGNSKYLLGLIESNKTNHSLAIEYFKEAEEYFKNLSHNAGLFSVTIEIIRSKIILDQLDEAEQLILSLNAIVFEGKGEKEEIEKLLLYIVIFIKRQEFSIALFSIDEVRNSIKKLELYFHHIILLNFEAIIYCLEDKIDKALKVVEDFKSYYNPEFGISRVIQIRYTEVWALLKINKVSEATIVAKECAKETSFRFLNHDTFYLPSEVTEFIQKYHNNSN